jgi:hypothetical protein
MADEGEGATHLPRVWHAGTGAGSTGHGELVRMHGHHVEARVPFFALTLGD